MQFITNLPKYLLLTLVTCSLLLIWPNGDINDSTFYYPVLSQETAPATMPLAKQAPSADSIWKDMSRELNLDHQAQSARVQAEIRKILAEPNKFYHILQAAGPYIYYIHEQTQARGLPAELALIPVIESEFNPNDHSNKGATGLWQLMPTTAQELGIKVRGGYDGRRNVVSSTRAALAYFKDLGNYFNGNWYLAIAAYNCGQMRIHSAVRRTGSHTFWNLPLPTETKLYVPHLLAVAAIVKNPDKYGIRLPAVQNKPYFTQVKVNKAVNLAQVAKTYGVNVKTMETLNPDYKKVVVPKKGTDTLLVPVNKNVAPMNKNAAPIVA